MAGPVRSVDLDGRRSDADPTDPGTRSRNALTSWLVLAVPVVVVAVGAWSYRWVQEDAFINFRIVANLLAGHGPVFNVGERVEVYSDPLWLFLLAGLHGITPFLPIEWLAVLLGIGCTVAGVVLCGRAVQRLAGSRGDPAVLPVGLLIFSVVPAVWEFTTSGLEMGMVFAWIGLSFWLLVRTEQRRDSALWCAFVVGLGTLIRPELILMTGVFLVAVCVLVAAPGWDGPTTRWRRYGLPLLVALALPVLYEVWRMAYFAMMVANTALTKSGGSAWWSQGLLYLANFIVPYALWVPLLLVLPIAVPRLWTWWHAGDRVGAVVLVAPVAAGLVDLLYVVHLGGDFMHARLLLPAFLAICLGLYMTVDQMRSGLVVALVGVVAWSIACGGWLRTGLELGARGGIVFPHGISDERSFWIYALHEQHPITTTDWKAWSLPGYIANGDAVVAGANHSQVMLIGPYYLPYSAVIRTNRARTPLPVGVIASTVNIGAIGDAAGPAVYIFDELSLANPIGSHTTVAHRDRPGHDKVIGPAWMIARFGVPGDPIPAPTASAVDVTAARRALGCDPLRSYLSAITAPLTFSQAMTDVTHAVGWTTMSYSPDPVVAARQLCG